MRAEKIYDKSFLSRDFNTTPLTISDLSGDLYDYEIFIYAETSSTTAATFELLLNSDTGSNYDNAYQAISTANNSLGNHNLSDSSFPFGNFDNGNYPFQAHLRIFGDSAVFRSIHSRSLGSYSTSDGWGGVNVCTWENSADELNSITIQTSASKTTDTCNIQIFRSLKKSKSNYTLIEESTFTAQNLDWSASPVSITGLDLDSDEDYYFEIDATPAAIETFYMRANSDTGNNYASEILFQSGASESGSYIDTSFLRLHHTGSVGGGANIFIFGTIKGSSSNERIIEWEIFNVDSGTGIEWANGYCYWQNTVDNLDSIQFYTSASSSVNGQMRVYKKKRQEQLLDSLNFKLIEKISMSGDQSAGQTVSNLSMNNFDVVKIEAFFTSATQDLRMQINGDTGTNYAFAKHNCIVNTKQSSGGTSSTYIELFNDTNNTGDEASAVLYLFPKIGRKRTIHGRSISDSITPDIEITNFYYWWLNESDEIDSLKFFADSTGDMTGTIKISKINKTQPTLDPIDLDDLQYDSKQLSVGSDESSPDGLSFSRYGTKIYVTGWGGDEINQYTLSTAWDISTASHDGTFSISAQEGTARGGQISADGTKFYVLGSDNNTIYQYTLSTAWDITSALYASKSLSVSSQDTISTDLWFKPDGTKVFIIGASSDSIHSYTLSTAWDISTGSYDSKSLSVSSQDIAPLGFSLSNDGTQILMVGTVTDTLYQYDLSTAWDLSTGSYASKSFNTDMAFSNPASVFIRPDNSNIYMLWQATDVIRQYSFS